MGQIDVYIMPDIGIKYYLSHHKIYYWEYIIAMPSLSRLFILLFSVSASLSTLVKPGSRLATPAGSCTAWSMGSSLMGRCPLTRLSVQETTPSTPSSPRLELASTCPGLSLLTWSQLLSVNK